MARSTVRASRSARRPRSRGQPRACGSALDPPARPRVIRGSVTSVTTSTTVAVPNLVGRPVDEALRMLRMSGLTFVIAYDHGHSAAVGLVVVQFPDPGVPVGRETPVRIEVGEV